MDGSQAERVAVMCWGVNMAKAIFIMLMATLALIDWRTMRIHNWIVLPAIGLGVYLTSNWHWALATYVGIALLYHDTELNPRGIISLGGGDVKLFTMIAAYLGIFVVPIFVFTLLLVKAYRTARYIFYEPLPVAPFALLVSICFLAT